MLMLRRAPRVFASLRCDWFPSFRSVTVPRTALEHSCRVSVVQFYKAVGRSSADVVVEKVKRAHKLLADGRALSRTCRVRHRSGMRLSQLDGAGKQQR